MSEEQRKALQVSLRGGHGGRAGHPVRPAGLPDQGVRGGQRQGRRRQVERDREPGGGPGQAWAVGGPARRRHLRPLGAADAGRRGPAHPGGRHDHAAAVARREGDLDRHVHRRQRCGGVARPDAASGAAAVPGRRLLGRPGRAAAGPAAGHRGRGHLAGPAPAERGDSGGDHPAAGRGRGRRAGRRDRDADPPAPGRRGGEHVMAGASRRFAHGDLRRGRRPDGGRLAVAYGRGVGPAAGSDSAGHPRSRSGRQRYARSCSPTPARPPRAP